ncbi:MAG TPA: PadR family transcriptional regulator [Rhodanobacteraceae bacterium]
MNARPPRRSPLAMVVLSFVIEAPSHAYRMHELIKQRGKDSVVNVSQRNSVYQTIARLVAAGLMRVLATQQDEGRPERVVYEITARGRKTFYEWLQGMLGEPRNEFDEFPAALATIMALSPDVALAALRSRSQTLQLQLTELVAGTRNLMGRGLPRVCVLDDEYKQVLFKAEIKWLNGLVAQLESGKLAWSEKALRRLAAQFEPPKQG